MPIEEFAPGFGVCSPDSLGGRSAENTFVLAFEAACIGVPDVAVEAVFVVVAHEALVIDLVPERGRSVQQVP